MGQTDRSSLFVISSQQCFIKVQRELKTAFYCKTNNDIVKEMCEVPEILFIFSLKLTDKYFLSKVFSVNAENLFNIHQNKITQSSWLVKVIIQCLIIEKISRGYVCETGN